MSAVVHPRLPARRGAARATRWWGKAWVRAVEESAYAERDLLDARSLARSGRVGQITVDHGTFVAAVEDDQGLWTVAGTVPVLDESARQGFIETVAAESGRVAALLSGDLPHTLVEHAEEAGVELLPYGSELQTTCTCAGWVDPCVHGLAVLHQLTWLLEADPFVLLHLRGLPRDDLIAEVHARSTTPDGPDLEADGDLDVGWDAVLRARRVLDLADEPDQSTGHLF